jgi:Fe-S-cluster formation regulator IscX/YfhJ
VIGIGEKKTLAPFITACDKFIYIEILKDPNTAPADTKKTSKNVSKPAEPLSKIEPQIIKLFSDSITALADEDGWAFLGELGSLMLKKKPDFDPRNYGFAKMLPLIRSINRFEIDERETGKKNVKHIYIRKKQ